MLERHAGRQPPARMKMIILASLLQSCYRGVQVMSEKKIGVVAHFYMDPEVQGVLSQASERWPHINISDSLAMADRAVKMAEQGCKAIAVLGVDFMSENVRAILDEAGHQNVKVLPPQLSASQSTAIIADTMIVSTTCCNVAAEEGPCTTSEMQM